MHVGGGPNLHFGIAVINRKEDRPSLIVQEAEGGSKADVECIRRCSGSITFLRRLSRLFKVRSIRFPYGAFHRTFKCNQVASLARGF